MRKRRHPKRLWQVEARRQAGLEVLAQRNNFWAKQQIISKRSGLSSNLQAYFKEPCKHAIETPNKHLIPLSFDITPHFADGFEIREKFCPLCAKTLKLTIKKEGEF